MGRRSNQANHRLMFFGLTSAVLHVYIIVLTIPISSNFVVT